MLIRSSAKSVPRRSRRSESADKYVLRGALYFAPKPAPQPAAVEPPQEQPKSEQAETVVDKNIAA